MLSAQSVTDPSYFVIAALVGMVVLVVGETDRIENQMVVNMSLVNMGGKYKPVFATQYFFFQLHSNLMGFLRGGPLQAQRLGLGGGPGACPWRRNGGVIQCRLFRRHSQRRTPAASRLVCRDCRICISKHQFDELLESLNI